MPKRPWDKIKEDYIYGYIDNKGQKIYPRQKDLSKKYNIPIGTISDRASREEWTAKRNDKAKKIQDKISERKTEIEAGEIVLSDDRFESAGEQVRRVAVKKLEKIEKDIDNDVHVRSIDIMNAANSVRIGQEIVKTAQGEILERVKVESHSNVKLNITDPEFMDRELEFANKLIQKRRAA